MKRVSETEEKLAREIPAIIGISEMRIKPAFAAIVPFNIEHEQIATGKANTYNAPSIPLPFDPPAGGPKATGNLKLS